MRLERDEVLLLSDIRQRYQAEFYARFRKLLRPVVGNFLPVSLQSYLDELRELRAELDGLPDQQGEIDDRFASLLRHAVIVQRLVIANDVEARRVRAIHPDVLEELDVYLMAYTALLNAEWFEQAPPTHIPQLTEFFPIEVIDAELASSRGEQPARRYDEKFHILQAPELLLSDFSRVRDAAAVRGISVALAYLDLDRFRDFNAEYGEPYIDRHVLPSLMRRIEAHVYLRGHAYRIGGDKYCVLLNNASEHEALDSMNRLREAIAALTYEGCTTTTTVSIGVVVVQPECHFTGHEIEQAAAHAKDYAKRAGRNCVASYRTQFLREQDLYVLGSSTVHHALSLEPRRTLMP